MWLQVRDRPDLWWDNRNKKSSANSPDFKLKSSSENVALWIEKWGDCALHPLRVASADSALHMCLQRCHPHMGQISVCTVMLHLDKRI